MRLNLLSNEFLMRCNSKNIHQTQNAQLNEASLGSFSVAESKTETTL